MTAMTPFTLQYRLEQERRPYRADLVRHLPQKRIGVYAVWLPSGGPEEFECLYVGKSETCIRKRLLDHLKTDEPNPILRRELRLFSNVVEFSAVYTGSDDETDALETAAIRAWQPLANRNKL